MTRGARDDRFGGVVVKLPDIGGLPDFRHRTIRCDPITAEYFWPDVRGHTAAQGALDMCRRCDQRDPCLEWALEHDEDAGIWGGTTPDERKDIAERRKEAPTP
jgi:WhiB family transcriptional regulator, redox-sensing transcriptional regulator